ncbi:MAG: hypothetical protein WAM07_02400 [Halobacillus sp.]|uniref:hypothetical protein n=1 Tax=Halobacillus sp. TaxID=56800 RepID=UPI003BAE1DF0
MEKRVNKPEIHESSYPNEVEVEAGLKSDKPLSDERYEGDSVDEHERLESANEYLGEKEIKQTLNNS